jgi:hypothetical protein
MQTLGYTTYTCRIYADETCSLKTVACNVNLIYQYCLACPLNIDIDGVNCI